MRNKIILMQGGTETLSFFSRKLQKGFLKSGYQTFLFDLTHEEESTLKLYRFVGKKDSLLVTFNFEGLSDELSLYDGQGRLFWEKYDIPCVNITVDHPYYYPAFIRERPKNYYQVSIDRLHRDFMNRHYPEVNAEVFLPLAGSSCGKPDVFVPIKKRKYDVVFTGNFVPKEEFEKHITRQGDEYAAFYRAIIDQLIKNPNLSCDRAMEEAVLAEFPDATDDEVTKALNNMIFIDTYVRFYFREKVVQTLVDNGIAVHCVGKGWEKLSVLRTDCFTYEGGTDSLECLKRMAQAKISLNVMPFFKDGAHDRVFNAMANQSVALTDHSKYLDEVLTDRFNACFYDLNALYLLPDKVNSLLKDTDRLEQIAQNGYALARKDHLWENRAQTLDLALLKKL